MLSLALTLTALLAGFLTLAPSSAPTLALADFGAGSHTAHLHARQWGQGRRGASHVGRDGRDGLDLNARDEGDVEELIADALAERGWDDDTDLEGDLLKRDPSPLTTAELDALVPNLDRIIADANNPGRGGTGGVGVGGTGGRGGINVGGVGNEGAAAGGVGGNGVGGEGGRGGDRNGGGGVVRGGRHSSTTDVNNGGRGGTGGPGIGGTSEDHNVNVGGVGNVGAAAGGAGGNGVGGAGGRGGDRNTGHRHHHARSERVVHNDDIDNAGRGGAGGPGVGGNGGNGGINVGGVGNSGAAAGGAGGNGVGGNGGRGGDRNGGRCPPSKRIVCREIVSVNHRGHKTTKHLPCQTRLA